MGWSSVKVNLGCYCFVRLGDMMGSFATFETVLVILAPTSQKADPTQVIKQVVEIRTVVDKIVFKEST